LEKKVAAYLRKSQALVEYRQQPISAEVLQAEIDRMAKNTKQPEVLGELFAVLRNDPVVIAECLARPALAERLVAACERKKQEPLTSRAAVPSLKKVETSLSRTSSHARAREREEWSLSL
jgi:hypothetical protein